MLVSAFSSHPDIHCFGELFRRQSKNSSYGLEVLHDIHPEFSEEGYRHTHASEYISAVFSTAKGVSHVGFKLMLGQNIELRNALIFDEQFRKILLYRENILACFSSECIAKVTGQGVATGNVEVKTAKVAFDPKRFQRYRERRKRLYHDTRRLLQKSGQDFYEIDYLTAVTEVSMAGLVEFIGADSSVACLPDTKKRNPGNILERFTDPDEVSAYLESIGREGWAVEEPARQSVVA
jgi:hypothetical protein